MTLEEHARSWVDMEPHVATLTALAGAATTVVEFGVRGGVSTWALLDGLPADGALLSVDIDGRVAELVPDRVRRDPRWRLLIADTSNEIALPAADLLFIDTSHEYHHTLHELGVGHRLGAVIALHDFALPDVSDAVHGFLRRHPEYELTVEPSQWGLAVLRR